MIKQHEPLLIRNENMKQIMDYSWLYERYTSVHDNLMLVYNAILSSSIILIMWYPVDYDLLRRRDSSCEWSPISFYHNSLTVSYSFKFFILLQNRHQLWWKSILGVKIKQGLRSYTFVMDKNDNIYFLWLFSNLHLIKLSVSISFHKLSELSLRSLHGEEKNILMILNAK